jgi:hypothetical protein
MNKIMTRLLPAAAYQHLAADVPAFVLDARPGTMRRFLGALDETWGGGAGFFEAHGVSRDTLDEWRTLFVSP